MNHLCVEGSPFVPPNLVLENIAARSRTIIVGRIEEKQAHFPLGQD
jgi:hypothetical protein